MKKVESIEEILPEIMDQISQVLVMNGQNLIFRNRDISEKYSICRYPNGNVFFVYTDERNIRILNELTDAQKSKLKSLK